MIEASDNALQNDPSRPLSTAADGIQYLWYSRNVGDDNAPEITVLERYVRVLLARFISMRVVCE